jgi:hypothetical protein
LSSDPAGAELMNPNRKGFSLIESQNWYSYTSNNPVKYVDPNGNISGLSLASGITQQFFSNPEPLGSPEMSEYTRQYDTVFNKRKSAAKVMSAIGSLPFGLTQVIGWLGIAAMMEDGGVFTFNC